MKTINCGLILRKPGESTYNAYRRFLWANVGLSIPVQRSTLLEILGPAAPRPTTTAVSGSEFFRPLPRTQKSTAVLALEFEHLTCAALKLPKPPATYAPGMADPRKFPSIQKNCTTCSAGLFHSALFDLPWLTHCPIHQLPLTERCPACEQAWPTAAELPVRQCAVCGIHITLAELQDVSAMAIHPGYGALEKLGVALYNYERRPFLTFTSSTAGETLSSGGYRVLPREVLHQLDASMRSDPIIQAMVSTYAPPVLKAQGCVQACSRDTSREVSPDSIPAWLPRVHQQVLRKVLRAIAASSPPGHRLCILPRTSMILNQSFCPHCVAFNIWHDLITHQTYYQHFPFALIGYELFSPAIGLPTVPRIFDELRFQECSYQLPCSLQRLLYYLDLWMSFVDLHHYVSGYINALDTAPDTPVATLWEEAHRGPAIGAIEFAFDSRNNLLLTIPKSLFRFEPTPRSGHSEQICKHPADRKAGLSEAQRNRFVYLCAENEVTPVLVADNQLLKNPRITFLETSAELNGDALHKTLEIFLGRVISLYRTGCSGPGSCKSLARMSFACPMWASFVDT